MTETTRRGRLRAETERVIRETARGLLVRHGAEAVTLRAIARELGITAPALYRYYDSRDGLLDQLRADVCASLAADLGGALDAAPHSDQVAQVRSVCRTFRRWALAHPQEFTLVFASPAIEHRPKGDLRRGPDQFGRVFLRVTAQIISDTPVGRPVRPAPAELRADLTEFRDGLRAGLTEAGAPDVADRLELGALYELLRFWVRVYGHVALEVFDRFPVALTDGEPLFESMLGELFGEAGMIAPQR